MNNKKKKQSVAEQIINSTPKTTLQTRQNINTRNVQNNDDLKSKIQARYEANMQQVNNKKGLFNDVKNIAANFGLGVKKAGESSLSYMESMSNNSSNYKTYNKYNAKLNKEKEQLQNLKNGKTIEGSNITQKTLPGLNDFKQQTQKQTEVNPILLKAKENSQLESPVNEYLNKRITADEEKIQKNIENSSNAVSKKIAELVPSIGQSVTGMAVSAINPGLGLAFWQTSAGGDYIRDAKTRGMNDEDALKYGTVMGAMESVTEKIGAELTVGVGKAFSSKGAIKGLKALGLDIGENFFEEAIMEPIQETVATMTGGKKTADWSNMMKRMLQSGIDGALTSIIMGGASAGIGKATKLIGKMQEGESISQQEIADTLKEINKQEEIDIEKVLVNSFGFGAQDLYKNTTVQEQIDNKLNNIAGNMSQYEAGKLIDKSNLSEEQKASLKRVAEKHNMTTEEVQNLINNPPQEKMQQTSQNQATESANNEVLNNNQQITQEQNKMAENGNTEQITVNEDLKVKIPGSNYKFEASGNQKVDNLRQDANKYFNNSEKAKNYVGMLEKIITDKNIDIRLDANLKTPDGKIANGSYSNGVITINPNSTKAGEFIAVHELTHAIGTKDMLNIVENYRKSNKEFDTAVQNLLNNYKSTELTEEALSDVSAQLFGNQEFINNVAQNNPNIFQKIYNEIKYLWHQFRGYKNQDQFIEDLYYKWTQAYKRNKVDTQKSNFSIQIDGDGNKYVKIDTNQDIFEGKSLSEQTKIAQEYILKNFREKGLLKDSNPINVSRKTANEYTHPKKGLDKTMYSSKLKASTELDNLLEISNYIKSEQDDGRHIFAKDGWDYYETVFKVGDKTYSGWLNIANGKNGKLLYDITNIKERASNYSVKTVSVANSSINNSIPHSTKNVNTTTKYSMQESENNSSSFNLPKLKEGYTRLYRGLENEYDANYDKTKLDNSNGYESWTDSYELAKAYGNNVYYIDVPTSEIKNSIIDEDSTSETYGDRNLIYANDKPVGLKGKSGNEYMLYTDHDNYSTIKYNKIDNLDVKYSKQNSKWQSYLNNNFKTEGTRTNLEDIKQSNQDTIENSNESSFSMQEKQTRMPEQVLLPGAKRNKSLNPTQIANLTLQDANTTPELKSKEYAKGNKQSSFVSNIITDSKFLNEDLRQEMAKEDNIKYYRGITNKETLEKAYQSLNENGANATFEWFNKQDGNSTAEDVAKGWILLKQYQDTGDYKSAVEVAKKMRNMGTTAGQTVQAYNILSRLTPEGMFYYAQSELSEAYNKMAEGKSKKWLDENKNDFDLTPEETQFIIDKMESIQGVEDERTKKIALAEIQKLITDKIPAKASQSLKAWMRISMLFNPKTQVRNVAGNAVILPVNMASDFIASGIDKAISKKTGVRTTGNTNLKNYTKGFGKGLFESYDDFRRGINTRNIEGNRFEVSEGKNFKDKGIGKALNRVDNMLSFMLDAGDRGFYEATFTNSINNQLVLNNTTEVTKDMIDIATQEALQRTWQDNNAYTQTVLTIRNALNGKVGKSKGMGYGLGDILIPFAKTPANLTKAIVDYSPVGLTKTLALDARKLKNSLENGQYSPQLQHKFVQDLGKGMAGSLLYVLGYALANAGAITGEADEDKDVKNFMKNSLGISSYSIKIGDKTFAYDWAQPIAAPLSISANIVNSDRKDIALLEGIMGNLDTAGSILLEQSFMQSMNDVLSNDDGVISGMISKVLELPTRAIPTFSKQVADMIDSTQRTTFEYGKPIQSAINSAKAKIPFVSNTLPASIDTLGNEIEKYGGNNNIWNVMFNPANMNKGKLSNAGAEIYKLYQQTGETTIFPITAPYYINNKGTKITMTSSERSEYQRKSGQYTQKAINELLSNNNYKNLSDDEKVELISEIVSDSNANAKYEVLGIESEQYEKQRKLIETISTDNYYDYKLNVMSKTNQKQIAENDDNAELTDIEKMKIITDKRYSSKAKEAIYETYIKDAESKEYDELKEYYANNSVLGAKNQRAYDIIDQYIDYKVKADDKIKELRANGTKTEDQKLTEVERIQLLKDCNYNNVQTEALYSTVVAEETGHKIYEELKKLNGKNSIQSYMTFMLSDRESAKEDDGTLSGKSISGSKLHKVQNTLKGMGQLNTISKIYLEATQASIKKYAPRDYTVLKNYLNSASEAEQTIIMETIQGTTKMKNGKYEY